MMSLEAGYCWQNWLSAYRHQEDPNLLLNTSFEPSNLFHNNNKSYGLSSKILFTLKHQ